MSTKDIRSAMSSSRCERWPAAPRRGLTARPPRPRGTIDLLRKVQIMSSEPVDKVAAATERVLEEQESNARATAGAGPRAEDQTNELAELAADSGHPDEGTD